jgi:hypothetical protein
MLRVTSLFLRIGGRVPSIRELEDVRDPCYIVQILYCEGYNPSPLCKI